MSPDVVVDMIKVKDVQRKLLVEKNYMTSHARKSFSYVAPRLWNNLPSEIRFSKSLYTFKRQTKYLLFNKFNNYMKSVFKYC